MGYNIYNENEKEKKGEREGRKNERQKKRKRGGRENDKEKENERERGKRVKRFSSALFYITSGNILGDFCMRQSDN